MSKSVQWRPLPDGKYVHDSIIDGRATLRIADNGEYITIFGPEEMYESLNLPPFPYRLCYAVTVPVEQPAIKWIPITERMPEPAKPVLVCHEGAKFWSRAAWIPKHHTEDEYGSYEGDLDWSEDGEHAYWPEGWYEHNNFEEIHWMIDRDKPVTHWAEVVLPQMEPNP